MQKIRKAYDMMEEWINWLQHRGRRPKTIETYRSVIGRFVVFMDSSGHGCRPNDLTEDDIHYFVDNYVASENTIRYYITVLGEWMKYYNDYTLKNMGLLWNNNGTPNAKWIYRYEFNKMLTYCKDRTERMILLLGAFCGLRRNEIAELKLRDYDGKRLIVTGKGHNKGKKREVPLTDVMIGEIESYLQYRKILMEGRILRNDGSLLVWPVGKRYINTMNAGHVGEIVREIAIRSGVSCSTHSLRRLFATSLFEAKVDAPVVQELMGHENIETTFRYVRKDMAKMKDAMDRITSL